MSGGGLTITAEFGGASISRSEVLAWEERRARRVCKKLDIADPPADLVGKREVLVARKLELGHETLERMLARELAWSARAERMIVALSRGRQRLCVVELTGSGGSAEAMPAFYATAMESGNEAALLSACPDHYILRERVDGVQEVVETTGGSPLVARIYLDGSNPTAVKTEPDPAFPIQWAAAGRGTHSGPIAGAIRHQFRDDSGRFTARLTGEFPAAMPPWLIRAHQWHLACEFSNWLEAANSPGAI